MADMKEQGRKPQKLSNYQIEKGLKQSLESTDAGLKQLLSSLRESGMAAAPQAYRSMQMVLIQQRLWADEHHRAALMPLFRSIAKTSGELHHIFASFTDVLKPLKEVDKLGKAALQRAAQADEALVKERAPASSEGDPPQAVIAPAGTPPDTR